MDKQELIEELECLEVATDSLDFLRGAHYANERAISLAKQLKESQHSISSNNTLEQIILTKTDESIVVMNTTKIEESEIIFVLAATLIGYSRRLGLNEVILNESMPYLWKDTRFNHVL